MAYIAFRGQVNDTWESVALHRIFVQWLTECECTGAAAQGQATDMDWTLHTDLWKSETGRDIKK